MRFAVRSLLGLVILALTAGLLIMAAGNIWRATEEMAAEESQRRPARERVFAAEIATLSLQSAEPVITTYGEIASARSLEVRAGASGRIVELSDRFRSGVSVSAGEVLARIDPSDAQSAVDIARAALAEARAESSEAISALEFAKAEAAVALEQLQLQEQSLERQTGLKNRGVGADKSVEDATIALANARSSELSRRQAVATAEARISRAEIGVNRAGITLNEAERTLGNTQVVAPFDGVVTEANAIVGRLVTMNEQLGTVIDASALEVSFRVSNAQFERLLSNEGMLSDVPVVVTLDLGGTPVSTAARLERSGAEVGAGQTGRLVIAALDKKGADFLRPGDFVRVNVTEPKLDEVAVIPAAAVASDGRMLVLGPDDRLEAITARVLRRQNDNAIVGDVPAGRDYVVKLTPQLGAGVKIKPQRAGGGFEEREMVKLEPERRAKLIAAIEGNKRMPTQVRDRLIGQLEKDEVPADVVARIEERIGGAPGGGQGRPGGQGGRPGAADADGPTMPLDPERRAKLVAFVEGSAFLPDDAKARILGQLQGETVPEALVERLESRMGG